MASQEYPDLPFIQPRAFGSGRAGYAVQYVVIHYTAGSERSTSAEDGAAYDQRRTDGTSTHYFVDSNSVVQCVYTWDRANSAFQYGNRLGIQYELCGTVQTRAQWLDAASDATLTNAARQIARDCKKYGLPVRRLTTQQMRNGEKGICGHVDVTNAYGLGDHTDPGPEFPWDVLLARVSAFLNGTPLEDDMPDFTNADVNAWRQARRVEAILKMVDGLPAEHGAPAETFTLPGVLRRIDDTLAALAAHPPGTVTVTVELMEALGAQVLRNLGPAVEAAAERAVRKVLGAVDGATPPA